MRLFRHPILISIATLAGLVTAGTSTPSTQNQDQAQIQRPGPPGTIRVRVRLIPVDVIVTNERGKPVADLTQKDFQVFENGRPQEIRHFAVQTFTAERQNVGRSLMPGDVAASETAPQPARTFLIVMGRGRHQIPLKAVDSLIQFVRNDLLPGDRVAVFAYNSATDFTTDHERIAQVLERYKKANDKIESWLETHLRGLAAVYGIKGIPKSLQADIDKIFQTTESMASRQVPVGRMTEKGTIIRDWDKAADVLLRDADKAAETEIRTGMIDPNAEDPPAGWQLLLSLIRFDTLDSDFVTVSLPFDEFAPRSAGSFQDLQNLYTCIEYLRYMEGEKHLIFFTGDGLLFSNGNEANEQGIVAMANDARVAIETFQTGGAFADPELVPTTGILLPSQPKGSTSPPPIPPPNIAQTNWSRAFMLTALQNISNLTGGCVTIGRDIGKALDRLNEVTSVEYLLGYYPQDDRWDGKYRQIHVKVNRPATKVSFRHGYYARDTLRPYDREEFLSYSRISAAGGYEFDIEDIPFKVTTAKAQDAGGAPQIKVDLQIDAEKIGFKMVGARHMGRLRIAIFYADAHKNHLGDNWTTMNMDMPEESYQRLLQSGIQFSALIPQKAPNQILKVVVYDTWNDKVGSKLVRTRL
jgi:VWFA-related protein